MIELARENQDTEAWELLLRERLSREPFLAFERPSRNVGDFLFFCAANDVSHPILVRQRGEWPETLIV